MSESASRATQMAQRLVLGGISGDEAVSRLLDSVTDSAALREAAAFVGRRAGNGYPAAPMHRLLLAAAGEDVAAPSEEVAAVEQRQRQLLEQPPPVTFEQLADVVPALRDLERRASSDVAGFLRELSEFERSFGGPEEPQAAEQFRIALGIRRAVSRLVGPFAEHPDPVVASPWAEFPVTEYLWAVATIDRTGWGSASPG